ncbi:MAG: chemotaxis protein CheR, partial [Proteobacteria bacterium]
MKQMSQFAVGIAFSAGGLSPLIDLLENASCHKDMCFIVVPHLSRDHESQLPKLLQKFSDMTVTRIQDGMKVQDCRLMVLPEGSYAYLENDVIRLKPRPKSPTNQAADVLFESLAESYGAHAIGVVLSG